MTKFDRLNLTDASDAGAGLLRLHVVTNQPSMWAHRPHDGVPTLRRTLQENGNA
ncbi:MAG: hypothetical protein Q8M88_13440 [Phenylobacterium sp.]|uniref:hypothetical protein n=1 Tax=Phenylobacterium sp. TaxID=1871053 RepID=UPI0027323B9A|nr:hypothetical protein [Phenylobacterium sp.]MDP3175431.1 hypothetical protein [Phenylobacterium sp.]